MTWIILQEKFLDLSADSEKLVQRALQDVKDRGAFIDVSRQIKRKEEERLMKCWQEGEISFEEMLLALTGLAQACLQAAYLFENELMRAIYGLPNSHFHMIAMGKFGGCEMTLQSDLDLIFLFAQVAETSGPQKITNQEYFARLVQRIISNLSMLTPRGRAYSVDTQLRPSGRGGILVSSWASFEEYHTGDARTWEKQALLKARPIEPDPAVREAVNDKINAQIWNRDYEKKIASEMHELRMRMEKELGKEDTNYYNIKVGPGGIVDIEFIVQYLQLRHGAQDITIRSPHTLTGIRTLARADVLTHSEADQLENAYIFYREMETHLRQIEQRSVGYLPRKEGKTLDLLSHAMGEDTQSLISHYQTYRQNVRQTYLKILGL